MKNILFLANIPSPYRVDFFNEWGKSCKLSVVFERDCSTERDDEWKTILADNFSALFLKGIRVRRDMAFCPSVLKHLNKGYDYIIVSNISSPTGVLALLHLIFKKIPYYIEGDGGFKKNKKGPAFWLKKLFFKKAAGLLATGPSHIDYYLSQGASEDKIITYPFSSVRNDDILSSPLTFEQKVALRKELGLCGERSILCVAQFIHRKGIDVLLRALPKNDARVHTYIIGGTPPESYNRILEERGLKNVHFLGFVPHKKLKEYYKAADFFVLPSREDIWGLVVNEAVAAGLPVITTEAVGSAQLLVENGVNGFIAEPENATCLAEKIDFLLAAPLFAMGEASIEKTKDFTIEKMAQKHTEIFK